ncbi:MAG: tRNA (adenosine(37)-N6)-threonylcarbamoyltransferase complex ATPase subunit type 1 TsaE [Roseobacter sp.]|jgi:tRNA threonylcarbamoyladenosine biosynthesis protein TsaE|nr:tRNA (adenosine(37)-N6)-threonylcarbamoyltransferase complex ATPase subunit type 1 TsaE [Roseobacter sp.]
MPRSPFTFLLSSPDATAHCAIALGASLRSGDTLLLEGDVGAGKTHFARHLIQSLLETPEDVPSPTFTLVQTYETTAGPLWHSDLYRIGSTFEIDELGLPDAFDSAICIVEWPDRLGDLAPTDALRLHFEQGPSEDARRLTATWTADRWSQVIDTWNAQ